VLRFEVCGAQQTSTFQPYPVTGVRLPGKASLVAFGPPQPDAAVVQGSGQRLTVGGERHTVDEVGLIFEGQQLPARGDLPAPTPLALPRRGQRLAVWGKRHRADATCAMTLE